MTSNQYDAQASTNYKEAFSLFDKRGNGRVALDSLGDLLRACGQNPTLSEIRDLEKNVGSDCELESFFPTAFPFVFDPSWNARHRSHAPLLPCFPLLPLSLATPSQMASC